MSWQNDYDNAFRSQFATKTKDLISGRSIIRFLPFQQVNIGGRSYIQILPETPRIGTEKPMISFPFYNHLQIVDDSPVSYNATFPPSFGMV